MERVERASSRAVLPRVVPRRAVAPQRRRCDGLGIGRRLEVEGSLSTVLCRGGYSLPEGGRAGEGKRLEVGEDENGAYRRAVNKSWRRLILWSRVKQGETERVNDRLEEEITKVCVFGAGSFGTAIATVLAKKYGQAKVYVVVRNEEQCESMNAKHRNPRYLTDYVLPGNVVATLDPREALEGCQYVVHAIPVQASTGFLEKVKGLVPKSVPVISVSKGLEVGTGLTMHQVLQRALGEDQPLVALSGPSFAKEVMEGLPTNLVAASEDENYARSVQAVFASPTLRVNTTRDVVGVEIVGALKNVVAIAAGIVDGLGLGNNALSALVAQGTAEIRWLAVRMGGEASTVTGVAGVGDIMLTSFVNLSRNRTVGVRLGRGESLQEILSSMTQVAEGVKTAEVVIALAKKYNLILPVLTAVAQVVDGQLDAKEAVDTVMLFPQIEDVDEGYDFFKESEPSTTRRASSSCEQTSELTGV
ncbi:glycerol-3-phosphate dehydrogenase [Chloropicon primus]|uniref:Glycerol-3-phosphate dehydrogenase [NAD(+)] n=1 Tax=Chloropicon primus TaxID=1764295 RepID=A0A5B8MHD1_9CHLO|nr:glycerol-3-phosphate dehydrogenase [Chloropicon primus]UPQ99087.1 glycerol-3-phosphate dehydrogenase [Chloropicon primus]|eukprot:QDZ19876.1 glycerol-3-phosphate dehydrogenase [Chloropicon primus]